MDGKKIVKSKKSGIKPFFKKLKKIWNRVIKNFKKMDRTQKYLIYFWGILILFVIVLLLFGGIRSGHIKKYQQFENKINEAALEYVREKEIYPSSSSPLEIQMDALESMGYLKKEDIFDDTCLGYAKISYSESSEDYKISSYLKCKKYITDGYSSKK